MSAPSRPAATPRCSAWSTGCCWPTIEEVGAACVFLASDYAAAMTGETLYVDGGYHILG